MAKITLGNRPKTFQKEVTFPMLDGSEGSIELTFKYRTRTEYGDFIDAWRKQREAQSRAEVDAKMQAHAEAVAAAQAAGQESPALDLLTHGELQTKHVEAGADFMLEIADGWNLDVAFTRDNIQQLCDELPAAAVAISDGYRVALTEARLGN